MIELDSSAILAAGYDGRTARMYLRFPNGKTYTYYRVPLSVFRGLLAASSHGAFYNRYIAGRYGP